MRSYCCCWDCLYLVMEGLITFTPDAWGKIKYNPSGVLDIVLDSLRDERSVLTQFSRVRTCSVIER